MDWNSTGWGDDLEPDAGGPLTLNSHEDPHQATFTKDQDDRVRMVYD